MTLRSSVLFEKWLESRAKASTGEAPASQLSLQAPIVLIFEEKDGVLVESRMMRACSWSAIKRSRHEVIEHYVQFDVEHDERYDLLDQIMIKI